MWQIWLIIAILFFILEMMGPGFLLFWVGVGALIAMVVSIFVDNLVVQIGVFTIASTVLLFCTRPFVKKFSKNDNTITNAQSIIGKKAVVTKEINSLKGTGQIKVNGEAWSAKSSKEDIIEEGAKVTILNINGVKAIVELAKEKTTVVE
ncbi:MAG: NfeD family protein [Clostridia bacterium]|nr:NfeD family protein [Clostridia bacterium]MBR4261577.1 NfeD family protein [Clostridia bacterium]